LPEYQTGKTMHVHLAKFMLYFQIRQLHEQGLSISSISAQLELNRRTVKKYLSMDEAQYEAFLSSQADRKKILLPYEGFIKERLELYSDTSAAQMHDWLKECYADFPVVSVKTVFNFVAWVRDKHHLPIVKETRQHQIVEETPYGQQAQVDFGEYNMRTSVGGRIKVYFFSLLLSRSRFKFIWFTDRPFTSGLAIQAHEQAFSYIQGTPQEVVYDQDKVFLVSENGGDIILTEAFRAYTREQSFSLHFCRKADPQSKGKVENLVKYIKQNFLYNRIYHNLETLNEQALAWLQRTANALPHAFTGKVPQVEWIIEQPFLKPYLEHPQQPDTTSDYLVRTNNAILYKGSLYSLPLGSYKGKDTYVAVELQQDLLIILDKVTRQEICRHKVASARGSKVVNSNHKRDTTAAIAEMMQELCSLLPDPEKGLQWLQMIKKEKPRYIRDQLKIIQDAIAKAQSAQVAKAIDFCLANAITRATDFRAILALEQKQKAESTAVYLNPLNGTTPKAALQQPSKSDIADYQAIVKKP
jgi:transposase